MNASFRLWLSLSLAAALLSGAALASCDGVALTDELPLSPPTVGTLPIGFDATTTDMKPDATSRAGEINTTNIASMGVFASYTGTSSWTASSTPNFMYNQQVTRSGTNPWTYTPMKYWPNTPNERISFFAYAPYGAASTVSGKTQAGYPEITCTVPASESAQQDVLVAAPIWNSTKNVASLKFTFRHMLAKMVFQVKSSSAIDVTGLTLTSMGSQLKLKLDGASAPTRVGSSTVNLVAKASTTSPVAVAMNATTPVATFYSGGFVGTASKIKLSYKQSGAAASTAVTEEVDFPAGDFFWDSTKKEAKHTIFTLTVDGEANLTVGTVNIKEDWPTTDIGNSSIVTPAF